MNLRESYQEKMRLKERTWFNPKGMLKENSSLADSELSTSHTLQIHRQLVLIRATSTSLNLTNTPRLGSSSAQNWLRRESEHVLREVVSGNAMMRAAVRAKAVGSETLNAPMFISRFQL